MKTIEELIEAIKSEPRRGFTLQAHIDDDTGDLIYMAAVGREREIVQCCVGDTPAEALTEALRISDEAKIQITLQRH